MTKPVPPLEWHPFYARHMWLLDWLNGDPAYPHHTMRIAQPQPIAASFNADSEPWAPWNRDLTLTKRRAVAPAPYVGRPFRYGWWYAADHLGRAVAGESFRVYQDGSIER